MTRKARPVVSNFACTTHSRTALREVIPGLLMKFECDNSGGSHKVRAARYVIEDGIRSGTIISGRTTVIEKTGGNFGFGLALACHKLNVRVELAVGLGFSAIKRRCLEMFGAHLIGKDMLASGATPKDVVAWHLEHASKIGRDYFYTDQFSNPASPEAHECETGDEIVDQLKSWPLVKKLTFVACAGTGASLTGITRALLAASYEVNTILVEPAGCDSRQGRFVEHSLEGMSVGVVPPFLDWNLVQQQREVTLSDAMSSRQAFCRTTGYFVGNTTAACLAIAIPLTQRLPHDHKVLSIHYDHGLWYLAGS